MTNIDTLIARIDALLALDAAACRERHEARLRRWEELKRKREDK